MPTTTLVRDRIFAGAEWIVPHTTSEIVVHNPVDRSEVGRAPDGSAADVDVAVRAAREAFDYGPWPRMSPAERADWIDRLADELESRATETAELITAEIGQPKGVAGFMGGIRPVQHLRYYAKVARGLEIEAERPNVDREGTTSLVRREPIGVAALIVPWNHPQASTSIKLGPALAAGCTVVIKPAAESPLDIHNLAEASLAIGMPEGVINIVPGGRETGAALVAHPGVDKVGFTGSSAAGRQIASVCGQRLIPATLELGGKSAAIVLDDADLDAVLASLRMAAFANSGQNCIMLSRVLAPRGRHDEVRDGLIELARSMRVGDPRDDSTELGPLVSGRIHERVSGLVDGARVDGADVYASDAPLPGGGFFYPPTIVSGVGPGSTIAQEEVFGPVVTLLAYDDVDDAVRIANDSRYGLGGAVYGPDDQVRDVARRIRTGTVGLNGYRSDLGMPFGGYKESGLGREFGPDAVYNYLETKTLFG